MKIVADENIPYAREAFDALGEVVTVKGRELTREQLVDAEVLLVRSVTKVRADLLDGTCVRFVGTATIGTDHVDTGLLADRGIAFTSAPGSNANSVSEYVVAALLTLGQRDGFELAGKTLGVVGVGNVGRRVVAKARTLGLRVLQNDPPRARAEGAEGFVELDRVLDESDFVTVHVPLTPDGPEATLRLIASSELSRLKPTAYLLNTSRGPVVAGDDLLAALRDGRIAGAVLDVWENEPAIDANLLQAVAIGTPHIAGYSFDGKVNATVMLYDAVCDLLDRPPTWRPDLPGAPVPEVTLDATARTPQEQLHAAVTAVYAIESDDARLREMLTLPPADRAAHFDRLRKTYPIRREFTNTHVHAPADSATTDTLRGLGFCV